MLGFDGSQMLSQRLLNHGGQHRVAIFISFPGPDDDLIARKVDIFDPETTAFHQSQSSPIEQNPHQTRQAVHVIDHFFNFVLREHNRQSQWPLCANHAVDKSDLLVENRSVKKQKRIKRLVLRRRADPCLRRQIGKKTSYLRFRYFQRMPLIMEKDKPFDPMDIRFLRSIAIVPRADRLADLIEELGFGADDDTLGVSATGLAAIRSRFSR